MSIQPNYLSVEVDQELFGKHVYESVKTLVSKHGVSKNTYEILRDLGETFKKITDRKKDNAIVTPADAVALEKIIKQIDKGSEAIFYHDDKFSSKDKNLQHAARVANKAFTYHFKGIKEDLYYGLTSTTGLYLRDMADHFEIAFLIVNDKVKEADNKVYYLDTASREEIPNSSYDFITNKKNHDLPEKPKQENLVKTKVTKKKLGM